MIRASSWKPLLGFGLMIAALSHRAVEVLAEWLPALQDVACPQLLDPLLGKLKPLGKNFVGVLANSRNASAAQWRRLRQLDRRRLNRHLLTARVFDFRNQLAMPNLRIIENILDRRNGRMRNVGVLQHLQRFLPGMLLDPLRYQLFD